MLSGVKKKKVRKKKNRRFGGSNEAVDLTGPWASPSSSSSAPALPRASSPTLTPLAKELAFLSGIRR